MEIEWFENLPSKIRTPFILGGVAMTWASYQFFNQFPKTQLFISWLSICLVLFALSAWIAHSLVTFDKKGAADIFSWIAVISIAALFGYQAFNLPILEVKQSTIAPSNNTSQNRSFEAHYIKMHPGERIWTQINDDIWIELHRNSEEPKDDRRVALYRKIKLDKYNKCKGTLVQRLPLLQDIKQGDVYEYQPNEQKNNKFFIPDDFSCSNVVSRRGATTGWNTVFPDAPREAK